MINKQGVSLDKLIERIDFGDDIEFQCNGRMFTILGWMAGGPSVSEQKTMANEAQFSDGETLVENYMIDGKTFAEHFSNVLIL